MLTKILIEGIPIFIVVGFCIIAYRYLNSGDNRVKAEGQKAYLFQRFIPFAIILIIIWLINIMM